MDFSGERPMVDLTYSDVFLVPRRSDVSSRLQVDLAPADGTPATIPLVSSNMNSVTGARLAATLARRGGLGVLPQDLPLQELDSAIRWVKSQPVPWDTPLVLPPDATAADALRLLPATPGHGIVVGDGGPRVRAGAINGIVPAARLATALPDARLGDLARPDAPALDAEDVTDPRAAFDLIVEAGVDLVAVVEHGHLVGTLSRRSALRSTLYRPAVDAAGRLAVAAAVGINGDVAGKARALAAAGVDVLVVDTAHGHQEGMLRALREVAALDLGLPIAAGNIVTAEGVHDLVVAGATILKVGVGPGAMCTTRMMTAVGRPQFSAVLETAEAARVMGAHVWADGGVRYPRDGLDQGRARAVRAARPLRTRPQRALRRGDLFVADLSRPAASGPRRPARHDHLGCAVLLHVRGRGVGARVPRPRARGIAIGRRLRGGKGAAGQLVEG
jgi:IMP dehydrogenase